MQTELQISRSDPYTTCGKMASSIGIEITAKQKKKTLSAKKTKRASKVRTVLAWPHIQSYWPLLDEASDLDLQNLLESVLAPARLPTNSIPRSALLKVDRDERQELRKATYAKPTDDCKQLRSSLLLGVNAVSRALEKEETSSVLLAGDIDPPVIGRHIIDMCSNKNVPAVIMPSLRKCTSKSLGFNCIALGLKSSASDKQHFQSLQDKIIELSDTFPKNIGPQFLKVEPDEVQSSDEEHVMEHTSEDNTIDPSVNIYKYRTSKKERVFVPEDPTMLHVKPGKRPGQDDFGKNYISFGMGSNSISLPVPLPTMVESIPGDDSFKDANLVRKRKISHYQPLIVKNIQSNPDKVKKKKVKKSS